MTDPKPVISMADVVAELQKQNLLAAGAEKPIAAYLEKMQAQPATPWYFQLLTTVGAWLAAIFFIAFLGVANLINIEATGALIALGLFFITGAVMVDFTSTAIFLSQLALAFSTAGHVLVLFAAGDSGKIPAILFTAILLWTVLYPLYRSPVHRLLSSLLVIFATAAMILDSKNYLWLHGLVLVEILGIALILFTRQWFTKTWKPAFYALVVSTPLLFLLVLFPHRVIRTVWWPSGIIVGLALVLLYHWITRDSADRPYKIRTLVLSFSIILLLAVVSTPGVLAAVGLMVLGYHLRENPLTGLGLVFFPVFIVVFYYNLSISLDVKSMILAGSGLLLLGTRWVIGRELKEAPPANIPGHG